MRQVCSSPSGKPATPGSCIMYRGGSIYASTAVASMVISMVMSVVVSMLVSMYISIVVPLVFPQ